MVKYSQGEVNVYTGVVNEGKDIQKTERTAAIYKVNMAQCQHSKTQYLQTQNRTKMVRKITVNIVNLTSMM
jgi:hypothetical protein